MGCIRQEIRSLIDLLQPLDELEQQHIRFTQAWLDSGAELFRKDGSSTPNPHLVTYFLVVDPIAKKLLLVDHKKANLWLPTGGHVEPNEHPKDTARREAQEELAIQATFLFEAPLFITVTNTIGSSSHTDITLWYILKGCASDSYNFDRNEFSQVEWFLPSEVPYDRAEPHLKRSIEKMNMRFPFSQASTI